MASFTSTKVARAVAGNYREYIVDIKPGAVYTAGGVAVANADIAAMTRPGETINTVQFIDSEINTVGGQACFDRTNGKLLFFLNGTEQTATANTATVRCALRCAYANFK